MSKEVKRELYAMIHEQSPDNRYGGTAYGHVTVELVERSAYDTANGFQPERGYSADYKDVSIATQIDDRGGSAENRAHSYGWSIGLAGGTMTHPSSLYELERAAKFVKRCERSAAKVGAVTGEPKTFGQFVAYHMADLKLAGIVMPRKAGDHIPSGYETERYRVMSASDLAWMADRAVLSVLTACRERAGKTGDVLQEIA